MSQMQGTPQGPDDNTLLSFKRPIGLDAFGRAMKAYADLISALEGREPTYADFTTWLQQQGYVE